MIAKISPFWKFWCAQAGVIVIAIATKADMTAVIPAEIAALAVLGVPNSPAPTPPGL